VTLYKAIVENNDDPLKLDRVQARIIGIHPKDSTVFPTANLQWCDQLSLIGKCGTPDIDDLVYVDFIDQFQQKPVYFGQVNYEKTSGSSVEDLYNGYALPAARNQDDKIEETRRHNTEVVKGKKRIYADGDLQIDYEVNKITFKSNTPFQDITIGGMKLLDFLVNMSVIGNMGLPAYLSPADLLKLANAIGASTEIKIGI